jgi:hypothetical protein
MNKQCYWPNLINVYSTIFFGKKVSDKTKTRIKLKQLSRKFSRLFVRIIIIIFKNNIKFCIINRNKCVIFNLVQENKYNFILLPPLPSELVCVSNKRLWLIKIDYTVLNVNTTCFLTLAYLILLKKILDFVWNSSRQIYNQ